jgi:hypothetical protein
MPIETQQISAENVVETADRVFCHPDGKAKVDLLTVSAPTDLDALVSQVNSLDTAVTNKGDFDASGGAFPADATSGDIYKVTVAGTIDGMDLTVGDVLLAIEDVVSTTDSTHWAKIDNSDGSDILRETVLDADTTLGGVGASDSLIPSQSAVKTYVDTNLDLLNSELMDEINSLALSSGLPDLVVSEWIDIIDDGSSNSLITLLESAKAIMRIYVEDWGDIIKGWNHTADTTDILFTADITHVGKRCLITYFKGAV